jgi:hypothetical protein
MRVVLAFRARDQADLVDALVSYHLNAGVEFVIATDHRSVDGTAEILQGYERQGYLRLLRDTEEEITPLRSEMARLAAEEHGADWVLHGDGDEFWWPRGGSIADVLRSVPERYGIVRGAWHHFAPRPEDGRHFAERMTVRISPHAPATRGVDPFHPQVKVAHRVWPGIAVTQGAHDAEAPGLRTLRSWFPFEVLHFPLRSSVQGRVKYGQLHAALGAAGLDVSRHVERAHREIEDGDWETTYAQWSVDEVALGAGLADGSLTMDTRLRDALRALAGVDELAPGERRFALPGRGAPRLRFTAGSHAGEAAFAHDTQPLHDLDAESRLHERVRALEARLDALDGDR